MANAKKCDRCGVYLDKDTIPHMKAIIDIKTYPVYNIDVDLCYECYSDLETFMSYFKIRRKTNDEEEDKKNGRT